MIWRWDKVAEFGTTQPRSGGSDVSPGRKPRVKWEIFPSRAAATGFSRTHFRRAASGMLDVGLQPLPIADFAGAKARSIKFPLFGTTKVVP